MIYQFIKEHQHQFRLVKMCEVLGVSRSGYYDWLKRPESGQKARNRELTSAVKEVFVKSQNIYGSRKITRKLRKDNVVVSERTVGRIMKEEGIRSKTVRKYKATTNSKHSLPVYPNLLNQNFRTDGPGRAWVTDITYIPTREGWLYLASVMDLYSRKIIGFETGERMTKELVIKALDRAMTNQPPKEGLIHHSDRGSQYASKDYTDKLKEAGITISMSRKGNCYDNACIESFHSIIKKELIFHQDYTTREEARKSIFSYIVTFYNSWRMHSTLGYMTPNEFERAYHLQKRCA